MNNNNIWMINQKQDLITNGFVKIYIHTVYGKHKIEMESIHCPTADPVVLGEYETKDECKKVFNDVCRGLTTLECTKYNF